MTNLYLYLCATSRAPTRKTQTQRRSCGTHKHNKTRILYGALVRGQSATPTDTTTNMLDTHAGSTPKPLIAHAKPNNIVLRQWNIVVRASDAHARARVFCAYRVGCPHRRELSQPIHMCINIRATATAAAATATTAQRSSSSRAPSGFCRSPTGLRAHKRNSTAAPRDRGEKLLYSPGATTTCVAVCVCAFKRFSMRHSIALGCNLVAHDRDPVTRRKRSALGRIPFSVQMINC